MAYTGKVDVNRGVMICTHRASGVEVYMYLDTPGVYFDTHLSPLPTSFAKSAGFPTETYEKKRQLGEAVEKVRKSMEETLHIQATKETYMEKAGFRLIHYPDNGMAQIESPAGLITKTPIALSIAVAIFNDLTADLHETEEGGGSSAAAGSKTSPDPAPSQPPPPAGGGAPVVQGGGAKTGKSAMKVD